MANKDKENNSAPENDAAENNKHRKKADIVYVVLTAAVFAVIAGAMIFLPRSTESELENRKLAEFPKLTKEAVLDGSYAQGIGHFFSDTVPMRDRLMEMASAVQELTGFRSNDIKLHNVTLAENTEPEREPEVTAVTTVTDVTAITEEAVQPEEKTQEDNIAEETAVTIEPPAESVSETVSEAQEEIPEDDAVSVINNGIAVVGTRAIMLYGGSYSVGEDYAKVVGKYKEALGKDVNVYCMVIPTSGEFYCPKDIQQYNNSQFKHINNIYSFLPEDVTPIDAYSALQAHTKEDIYFRTDHHWSSLGAYYAAQVFADAAEVPFLDLEQDYDKHVVDGYVGTMYSYTQDITIKNNPEDFFYYVPKVGYDVTYYNYILGEGNKIIGMDEPFKADFFINFTNSKSMLYCTFMGSDAKITHVHTDAGNGRRLAIFKDSYGNALPQFLFGSFEDIYVLDMRYFTYNAIDYLKKKKITDVLFANNAFHATTRSTVTYYENFLTQGRKAPAAATAAPVTAAPAVPTETSPAATSAPKASEAVSQTTTTVTSVAKVPQ